MIYERKIGRLYNSVARLREILILWRIRILFCDKLSYVELEIFKPINTVYLQIQSCLGRLILSLVSIEISFLLKIPEQPLQLQLSPSSAKIPPHPAFLLCCTTKSTQISKFIGRSCSKAVPESHKRRTI